MTLFPDRPFHFDADAFGAGKVGTVNPISVDVYETGVKPHITAKQQNVLLGLALWEAEGNSAPTSGELVDFMVRRGLARDCNSVRPRLGEILALGLIVRGAERKCQISGNTSATWYSAEEK